VSSLWIPIATLTPTQIALRPPIDRVVQIISEPFLSFRPRKLAKPAYGRPLSKQLSGVKRNGHCPRNMRKLSVRMSWRWIYALRHKKNENRCWFFSANWHAFPT